MSLRERASSLWQRLVDHGRRNRLPVSEDNAARLLLSGCRILETTRTLIDEARTTVHLEIYAWADDRTGRALLDSLLQAQARGVQVRGVVDFVGSWGAAALLEASGLELRLYHSLGRRLPWRLWHRRNHRKLLIADGCRAVAGSANWADAYNCELNPGSYRDLGLELQGPVVAQLEEDFGRSWARAGGRPFPSAGAPVSSAVGSGWHRGVAIQVVSSLNGGGRSLRRHLLLSLRQLHTSAVFANAYFIPDPQFLRVLLRTARRGVQVDLIVPGDSDHPFVQAASRATYARLLRAGVRIWERGERMFHAKAALLDRDLAVLGSANLDSRSFRHNLELNLVLRSEGLATELRTTLDEDRTASARLTLQDWEALPPWRRFYQRFAYGFWWWL